MRDFYGFLDFLVLNMCVFFCFTESGRGFRFSGGH